MQWTSGIYLNSVPGSTLIRMNRPPVQMPFCKLAGVGLLLLGLGFLAGCQGISAAGSQQQTGSLSFSNGIVNFGSVPVGSSKMLTFTATNTGSQAVTIRSTAVSTKYFALTGVSLPLTVPVGQSATVGVKFMPTAVGNFGATVSIASDASNGSASISLGGTGTADGQLALNPASEAFGSMVVGSKQSQTVTLTNTGMSPVNISQASISGTGFQLSGITTPFALKSGQSAALTVSFTPQATGTASGKLTITSDGSNPNLTMALSGTGTSQGALASNPAGLSFGNVTVGSNQSLSGSVTNTGGSSVTISQIGISGTGFSLSGITTPLTLSAGQSTTFSVSFSPASVGTVNGNVTVTSNAPNPTFTIPLSATGVTQGTLGANPTSLGFGNVTVGSNQSQSESVTNTGGSSLTISQIGISGTGFSLSGITTPLTLSAGQSKTFGVSFSPASAGAVNGNVTVTSNASNPTLTIPLSGSGAAAAGQLTVTPATLSLGSVVVGTSGTASGTLTASGANVTVTGASSNSSAFSVGGLSLPVTIPTGQSASFTVTFSPLVTGSATATLTFTSNAQLSTTSETLTGTGLAAPTHSVNLSWNASTSSNIVGYNIYRSVYVNSCGSFSKINSVLNTSTLYTDSVVVDGTSYCYATTAVDSSNVESGYSNITSNVQIPAP